MTETAALPPTETSSDSSFVRPRDGRIVAGVCAGIAQKWGVDLTLVRVLTVVVTLASGVGLAAYLAVWLLTPSVDGPAPLRPGTRAARTAGRLPAFVLIVLAAMLLFGIGHALWWGIPIGLLVVALLLGVIAMTRGGRWFLGSFLLLVLVAAGVAAAFGPHFGTRTVHVTSASDLRADYNYGAGTVDLDLSSLDLAGRHATTVRVGRGDVHVVLPPSTAVVVHARSGIGRVTIDGHEVSGIDAEQTRTIGVDAHTADDRLRLDVLVGAGTVDVRTS